MHVASEVTADPRVMKSSRTARFVFPNRVSAGVSGASSDSTPLDRLGNALLKDVCDRTIALVMLSLLSPVVAAVVLSIKLSSPGPVIYRRRVVGRSGVAFDAFKFRTMIHGAEWALENDPTLKEAFLVNYKLPRDPRVTRLGAFLRKYSLDELPQLVNVLRGEMWLVGPRMVSPAELDRYGRLQAKLLSVKPGLTGLWQVSGRQLVSYERRIEFDMFYIDHWRPGLDVSILVRTLFVVAGAKGAY
jgi:lipopolysaccharide/colanic/teichoic acid biosynthesis glycosyltransferase